MKFKVGDFVSFIYDYNYDGNEYYYCNVIEIIDFERFNLLVISSSRTHDIGKIYSHSMAKFDKITDKELINKLNKMLVFK